MKLSHICKRIRHHIGHHQSVLNSPVVSSIIDVSEKTFAAMISILCVPIISTPGAFCADSNEVLNPSQWFVQKGPNGVIQIMDFESYRFVQNLKTSKLPFPTQKALDEMLHDVKSIKIYKSGMANGKPLKPDVLFASQDPSVIADLKTQLKIIDEPFGHDPCLGGPTIGLIDKDSKEIFIGVHHGSRLRSLSWRTDATLRYPKQFIAWLASKGVTGPQEELEVDAKQAQHDSANARQKRFDQFVAKMPKSLRVHFQLAESGNGPDKASMIMAGISNYSPIDPKTPKGQSAIQALSKEFPSTSAQILALLDWSGVLDDISDGFESLPIDLLIQMDPSKILDVVKGPDMSQRAWIGASRLYSNMGFRDLFPHGYPQLDKTLSGKIIEQVQLTGKNQADLDEFKEALTQWQYPVRLERIMQMIEDTKKAPQSVAH
jgi:hypothetical protein